MSEAPRFSLIVPAFNEAVLLPRLLNTVEVGRSRYANGQDRIEVIVADNCTADRVVRRYWYEDRR